jgi:hypothetical protein
MLYLANKLVHQRTTLSMHTRLCRAKVHLALTVEASETRLATTVVLGLQRYTLRIIQTLKIVNEHLAIQTRVPHITRAVKACVVAKRHAHASIQTGSILLLTRVNQRLAKVARVLRQANTTKTIRA